jgi:hypothetical protein
MQNQKTTEQLIREYEINMPPEIMDMIKQFDWKRELRMIVMQNQVMVDVGADLEQSVYLMLIGIAKVEDVYERLIDAHELSPDKAKKILEEIENKIFNPLFKKLSELEDTEETESITTQAQGVRDPENRDEILAEIEKEHTEIVIKPEVLKPVINNIPETEIKINTINTPVKESNENVINSGVARPFSFNNAEKVAVKEPLKITEEPVKGIQSDPIASGLSKPTVMAAPLNTITPNVPPKTAGAPDPYREPIE